MRSLVLAVALAALAPTALAQEVQIPNSGLPTVVTYTLRAFVPTADAPVPSVVTQLSNDPHLARLSVATRPQMDHTVDAEFVFESVAEYVAWRESPGTAAWMRDLEANSVRGIEAAVNVRRRALERFLPQAD